MQHPPTEQMPDREPESDIAWLEPYPDAALDGIADDAPGPDARYEMREAVQLAFIAVIQLLPPRQRASLLLSDVLGWPAADTARLLGFIGCVGQQRASAGPRDSERAAPLRPAAGFSASDGPATRAARALRPCVGEQ